MNKDIAKRCFAVIIVCCIAIVWGRSAYGNELEIKTNKKAVL